MKLSVLEAPVPPEVQAEVVVLHALRDHDVRKVPVDVLLDEVVVDRG